MCKYYFEGEEVFLYYKPLNTSSFTQIFIPAQFSITHLVLLNYYYMAHKAPNVDLTWHHTQKMTIITIINNAFTQILFPRGDGTQDKHHANRTGIVCRSKLGLVCTNQYQHSIEWRGCKEVSI